MEQPDKVRVGQWWSRNGEEPRLVIDVFTPERAKEQGPRAYFDGAVAGCESDSRAVAHLLNNPDRWRCVGVKLHNGGSVFVGETWQGLKHLRGKTVRVTGFKQNRICGKNAEGHPVAIDMFEFATDYTLQDPSPLTAVGVGKAVPRDDGKDALARDYASAPRLNGYSDLVVENRSGTRLHILFCEENFVPPWKDTPPRMPLSSFLIEAGHTSRIDVRYLGSCRVLVSASAHSYAAANVTVTRLLTARGDGSVSLVIKPKSTGVNYASAMRAIEKAMTELVAGKDHGLGPHPTLVMRPRWPASVASMDVERKPPTQPEEPAKPQWETASHAPQMAKAMRVLAQRLDKPFGGFGVVARRALAKSVNDTAGALEAIVERGDACNTRHVLIMCQAMLSWLVTFDMAPNPLTEADEDAVTACVAVWAKHAVEEAKMAFGKWKMDFGNWKK